MIKNFCVLLGMVLILAACASSQEKQELKNPIEVLNGKTYNAREDSQLGGIPVTGTKNQVTRIRGVILQGEGVAATPLKHTSVRLLDDDGVTIANATSDIKGAFVLSGIFFNGHYVVEITSKKFSGATRVYVNRYDQEITVYAKPAK